MKKIKNKVLILFTIFVFILTGCQQKKIDKIKIENKYYDKGGFIELKGTEVEELINNKESFVLFTYNYFCNMPIPTKDIINKYMENNNIRIISVPYEEYKKINIEGNIEYAPSVIIFDKGKIIKYLDAESNADLPKFQNIDKFTKWIETYVEYK